MAIRISWFRYNGPYYGDDWSLYLSPMPTITSERGFAVALRWNDDNYTESDLVQTAAVFNMVPYDPNNLDVEPPPEPVSHYIRLERDAALSVSSGSPEIPFDATAEASSSWTLDSGAAKWTGAANTPVRGHAAVKVSGLLAVLTSITVQVWKNRGGAGEKLLGEVARKLSLGLGDVETVQVSFRGRVSNGDTISVEAVPNGLLAPSLVVGGSTHLEIG